jgi:hypothetical protein
MFDLTKQLILSSSTRLATLAFAALASTVVGACWNGNAADGLPCNDNAQCGAGTNCINGYCAGVFLCSDGTRIDATAACDATVDCEDGSDEDIELCGGGGAGINQCDEPDGDLTYQLGGSAAGQGNANKVVAIDIMGTMLPDGIVASHDGNSVKVVFDLETDAPKEYFFGGNPMPFGDRTVFDFEAGDVNGDNKQDIVIVTVGTTAVVYVYQNMAPDPPEPFGQEITVPDFMVGEVTVRGVDLGRFNNDSSTDIVAVLDVSGSDMIPAANGVLLVSFGDSGAAAGGDPYFNPQVVPGSPLSYDMFIDSAVGDFNGDGFDDLIVSGTDQNGAGLWLVHRDPSGDFMSWEPPIRIPLMAPGWIAVGHYTNSPGPGEPLGARPGIAVLDPNNGLIQTMINPNGMLQPGTSAMLTGSGYASLSLADVNCDGQADFIYSLTDPAEIRVLFGDGLGGAMSNVPLVYADQGTPRGGLGIALFDADATPDIFSSGDPGDGQMDTRVRVLVSGAP